jgi:hypothetical protein
MTGRQVALGSLCGLLAACSSKPLDTTSPPGARVWTETSSSIEVGCFGFFQGSMRFVATRDQLSPSQLDMLSRMTVVEGDPTCFSDYMGCTVTVGDANGITTAIDSNESNIVCDRPRQVVSWETFNPFRLGLGCQYAKDLTGFGPDPTAPVTPDARCFNGVFTSGTEDFITVTLGVDDTPPPYHIELDDCAQSGRLGKLWFTVFDSDGATVLGSSAAPADPGPDGTCAALQLTFSHSGGYPLEIGVAPDTLPGDFSLRFY